MVLEHKYLSFTDYLDQYEDMEDEEVQGIDDEMIEDEPLAFPTFARGVLRRYPPTVRLNSNGNTVRYLQSKLNVPVDGRFGSGTETAVRAFQQVYDLDVDGIAGPQTWSELLDEPLFYMQNDPRWNRRSYTSTGNYSQTIGSSGCGPTSLSCIINSLQTRVTTVPRACDFAVANGYRSRNNGTSWGFFPAYASRFNLNCESTENFNRVVEAFDQEGTLVVGNMGPGYFTKSGHYIVLWAADPYSRIMYALDPASRNRISAPFTTVQAQGKRYFIITAS